MRINKFIALALGISRRKAEELITSGQIKFNQRNAKLTDRLGENDRVLYQGKELSLPKQDTILLKLNKPVGYVCTHSSQGGDPTIFELLPKEYKSFKIIGRLDKNTSGLVLLTNNGELAHQLMHPKFKKEKTYIAKLKDEISDSEINLIEGSGVDIGDQRKSRLKLKRMGGQQYQIIMQEGRNRQIRRTFEAIGNQVIELKRLSLGDYKLDDLEEGDFVKLKVNPGGSRIGVRDDSVIGS